MMLQSCLRNVQISTTGLARIKTRSLAWVFGHLASCLLSLAIRLFEKFDFSKSIFHLFQKKNFLQVSRVCSKWQSINSRSLRFGASDLGHRLWNLGSRFSASWGSTLWSLMLSMLVWSSGLDLG